MDKLKKIKEKILGTSLQRKTKILLINIAIGFFLLTTTAFLSLVGLKYDYDSNFLNQEQKLKQLIIIQNIYSDILAKYIRQEPIEQRITYLKEAWDNFSSIQETSNYGTQFKDFYTHMFLNYAQEIEELSKSEEQIAKIINTQLSSDNKKLEFIHFKEIAFALNNLLHRAIELRIEILNLKKSATDSLFLTSLIVIAVLISIIIVTTLFFSQIIISSIRDLHQSLERVVFQKTKELRKFNDDLQQMIQQEVKESRQKDQIMYQQARLASIGEMIQNVAHQWRQPLNSLILLIQSFKTKSDNHKLTQDFIDTQTQHAIRIAKNMSNTIENFRNFFQPHSAKEEFSLQKSIQDSLNILDSNLKHNNIDTFVAFKEEIMFFGYENAFTQVILNLVNNAKDAIMSEKIQNGRIEIVLTKEEERIILQIQDNAGGIKVADINKIFEPYFTTKHKSVGTGVGLYMVKQIVEKQMEGKISVKNQSWISKISNEKYFGAIFEITLPYSTLKDKE